MKLSDMIADMILDMFEGQGPTVQIQRNDLAQQLGCVPSQINYVITSRFTPEQGYQVESRRGGGGYILITRAAATGGAALMHLINSIGDTMDERTARANIYNLHYQGILAQDTAGLLNTAMMDKCYGELEPAQRNRVRATLLKQLLLTQLSQN